MGNRFGILESNNFLEPCEMYGMYNWQATMEDFLKANRLVNKAIYQEHIDSFSSSVKSMGDYIHAIVFVDTAFGYKGIYGMKTKNDVIHVVQRHHCRPVCQA